MQQGQLSCRGAAIFHGVQGESASGERCRLLSLSDGSNQSFHWQTESSTGRTAADAKFVLNRIKKNISRAQKDAYPYLREAEVLLLTLLEAGSGKLLTSRNHVLHWIKVMNRKSITPHLFYSIPIKFIINISGGFPKYHLILNTRVKIMELFKKRLKHKLQSSAQDESLDKLMMPNKCGQSSPSASESSVSWVCHI